MERYQLREAVQYTGIPRGTIKSRRETLRDDPKHPDRKYLYPSDAEYKKLVAADKDVQWELDVEILDRWKKERLKKKAQRKKTNSKTISTTPNPEPHKQEFESGGVIELLRDELKNRKGELDNERDFFREQLKEERQAYRDAADQHRLQLGELSREIRTLSVENKELRMLTEGVVFGANAASSNWKDEVGESQPKRSTATVINVDSNRRRTVLVAVLSGLGICLGFVVTVQLVLP